MSVSVITEPVNPDTGDRVYPVYERDGMVVLIRNRVGVSGYGNSSGVLQVTIADASGIKVGDYVWLTDRDWETG